VASCCCSFDNKFIFKFGGILSPEMLNNHIERYDPHRDVWEIVDANIADSPKTLQLHDFKLLSTSACVQVNKKQLMVFGGYNEANKASN